MYISIKFSLLLLLNILISKHYNLRILHAYSKSSEELVKGECLTSKEKRSTK